MKNNWKKQFNEEFKDKYWDKVMLSANYIAFGEKYEQTARDFVENFISMLMREKDKDNEILINTIVDTKNTRISSTLKTIRQKIRSHDEYTGASDYEIGKHDAYEKAISIIDMYLVDDNNYY